MSGSSEAAQGAGGRLPRLLALAGKLWAYALGALTARWRLRACRRVGLLARTTRAPRVGGGGVIELGARVHLGSYHGPVELQAEPGARLLMGPDVFVNFGARVHARQEIRIGHDAGLGPYVVVSDCEVPGPDGAWVPVPPQPVVIEENVWLGAHVRVLPGAVIGAGATVVAGSEVRGALPAGCVAGGVPARVIRMPTPAKERS